MSGMTRDTFRYKKNDAVRRTKEMHSRSQCNGCNENTCSGKNCRNEEECIYNQKNQNTNSNTANAGQYNQKPNYQNGIQDIINNIISSFSGKNNKIDSDMLIIILFLIILARDGADKKLLLALGYILM